MQIASFIDNEFFLTKSSFNKLNPFNNEVLYQINSCDLLGAIKAIKSANLVLTDWSAVAYQDRVSKINKIKNLLVVNLDRYSSLEALDQGLNLEFTKKYNLQSAIQNIEISLAEGNEHESKKYYSATGLITIVGSYNLSLKNILNRLVPALLAGNSVIVKVSSTSPATALILQELATAAELPKGLVQVILTNDLEIKSLLVSHPAVKAVSVNGSADTIQCVLKQIQQSGTLLSKKIHLAGGSKNPAVILTEPNDTTFDEIINSFLIGQGQLVYNSAKLYILEKHEEQWLEKIKAYFKNLQPAKSIEDKSTWGPVLKPQSFEKFAEIKKTAIEDQAKIIEPEYQLSDSEKTNYLKPVFTKDMSRCSTLQQDQIQCPFFILQTVKYPFDVAKYSNVSYFGYAAHLWGDADKLQKVAISLDVGLVSYNKWSVQFDLPIQAVKQSAFGIQDQQIFGAFYSNAKILT